MRLALLMVATILTADGATATAQPGNAPLAAPWAPAPPVVGPVAGEKRESTALWLSLGGTVASIGLLALAENTANDSTGSGDLADGLGTVGAIGLWFAPSAGHWYAGKLWTTGLGLRLAGAGVALVGVVLLVGCIDSDNTCDEGAAAVLMVGGAAAFVGGGIYDIATAPTSVREHNDRLRGNLGRGWSVAPSVRRDGAGLVVGGRF